MSYYKFERELVERGRRLGIRQAAAFVRKSWDQPTIAGEILKYVIPHGYRVKSFMTKQRIREMLGKVEGQ